MPTSTHPRQLTYQPRLWWQLQFVKNLSEVAGKNPKILARPISNRFYEASESASMQSEFPSEAASESSASNVQESFQLIAVPAENFGGPGNLHEESLVPVNNAMLHT